VPGPVRRCRNYKNGPRGVGISSLLNCFDTASQLR